MKKFGMKQYLVVLLAALLPVGAVWADAKKTTNMPSVAQQAPVAKTDHTIDYIVAVVNQEPISYTQFNQAVALATRQLQEQGQTAFDAQTLQTTVLNRLINEQLQLQAAKKLGLVVDDNMVQTALLNMAQQHGITLDQLYKEASHDGLDKQQLGKRVRDQILVMQLRDREVNNTIKISAGEIKAFIDRQEEIYAKEHPALVKLRFLTIKFDPTASSADRIKDNTQADAALKALAQGQSFAAVAKTYAAQVHDESLQPASAYPAALAAGIKTLKMGALSPVIQVDNTYYIAKVLDRQMPPKNGWAPTMTAVHVRHILIRVDSSTSKAQAIARLTKIRQAIVSGKVTFAEEAQKYSQDPGSKANGGDLGWMNPQAFVPEFTQAMEHLIPGEVSQPVVTRFGVHLIEFMGKQQEHLDGNQLTEWVGQSLKQEQYAKAYDHWMNELRQNAYIDIRHPPESP